MRLTAILGKVDILKLGDTDIPDATNFASFVMGRVANHDPDKPAFIDGVTGDWITWGSFLRRTAKLTTTLLERYFICVGHRCAILSAADVRLPEVIYASAGIGMLPAMMNTAIPTKLLAGIMVDFVPRVVFHSPGMEVPVQLLMSTSHDNVYNVFGFSSSTYRGLFASPPADLQAIPGAPRLDDLALMVPSAGYSGHDQSHNLYAHKLCTFTHSAVIHNIASMLRSEGSSFTADSVLLQSFPPHTAVGMQLHCLLGPAAGVPSVIIPGRFDITNTLAAIHTHRVTHVYGPPALISALVESNVAHKFNLTSVTQIVITGGATGTGIIDAVLRLFPKAEVRTAYSVTETLGICAVAPAGAGRVVRQAFGFDLPWASMASAKESPESQPVVDFASIAEHANKAMEMSGPTSSKVGNGSEVEGDSAPALGISGERPSDAVISSEQMGRDELADVSPITMKTFMHAKDLHPIMADETPIEEGEGYYFKPLDDVGVPVPGMQVLFVDADTEIPLSLEELCGSPEIAGSRASGPHVDAILPRRCGEIWLRGPSLFESYWRNPTLNEIAFVPDPTSSAIGSEFFRTGDIGGISDSCQLQITERAQHLVCTGKRRHVSPTDCENVVKTHPDVLDAVVVGFPRLDSPFEHLRAYVQLKRLPKFRQPSEDELTAWYNSRVTSVRQLGEGVVIVDKLPRSGMGRPMRSSACVNHS